MSETKKALISVWDKTGVLEFAKGLVSVGYEIISSSGTAKYLKENGIDVTEVEELTGFPSILGGRVKTLHPTVMGGILARRDLECDEQDRKKFNIPLIDIVVTTLYPFQETAKHGANLDELIEKIDIGGVSLIRAAAKNCRDTAVVTDMEDYPKVLFELQENGGLSNKFKQALALKAFRTTSKYDSVIYKGLSSKLDIEDELSYDRTLPLEKTLDLRYGENPHQKAALFVPSLDNLPFKQEGGKELSYNNLLDLDTILRGCFLFSGTPFCMIVKHTTPCGTACGKDALTAFTKALECDPVSAFGGIIGFNCPVDMTAAEAVTQSFFEIIASPSYEEGVIEYLRKKKPNLRVLCINKDYSPRFQITGNRVGFLIQEDKLPPLPDAESGRWVGPKRPDLWDDMIFAWKTAAVTKSNAIVIAKDGAAIGIGGGFTNRVDAAKYALRLAGEKAKGAVLASDAFFPFYDTVELAAKAQIAAIIQPGGSMRDDEVCEKAVSLGVSMFIGGSRTFRH